MLNIKSINNKIQWENFLLKAPFYPFFQSWNFGEVSKKLGRNVERFGLFEREELKAVFSVIEVKAKRGHYFHLRHGPVLLDFNEKYFKEIIGFLKKLGDKKKVSFIRVSPLIRLVQDCKESRWFKKQGFLSAPIHNMDAENCLVLDIEKSQDQLLSEMRKTHRYLVRKSITSNIKVVRTQKVSDIKSFLKLYKSLSERKGFVPHKDVEEEFESFVKDDQSVLFFAEYEGKIIAGAFIDFVGNMGIYRHGASLDEFRNIPASYLLQWEAILESKKRGKKFYNFWGIAPENKPNHPWRGLSLFKTGFGGEKYEFLHARDLPINFWYWKNYLIEMYTRWRKGY